MPATATDSTTAAPPAAVVETVPVTTAVPVPPVLELHRTIYVDQFGNPVDPPTTPAPTIAPLPGREAAAKEATTVAAAPAEPAAPAAPSSSKRASSTGNPAPAATEAPAATQPPAPTDPPAPTQAPAPAPTAPPCSGSKCG